MPSGRFDWLVAAVSVMLAAGCNDSISLPKSPAFTGSGPSVPTGPTGPATARAFGELSAYAPPLGAVEKLPAVLVTLPSGQALSGAPVSFAVTAGGGQVRDTLVFTDATGIATCGGWTLGPKEVVNTVVATSSYQGWTSKITFSLWAVRTDGTRYNLVKRDGKALGPGEDGFLLLANDRTFRTVWTWGAGSTNPYVAINIGWYARDGAALGFFSESGDRWADGDLQNDVLTFSYDDYLDIGFHYIIVEVYQRTR